MAERRRRHCLLVRKWKSALWMEGWMKGWMMDGWNGLSYLIHTV